MGRYQSPGRRPPAAGSPRRPRSDETLPGLQFPIVEDLSRIAADDEFLDAIAAGGADLRSVFAGAAGTASGAGGTASGGMAAGGAFPAFVGSAVGRRPVGLGPLLVAWRSELLEQPFPALPTLAQRPMLAPADRSRRRSMRSLLSVGAAICALLVASTVVGAHSAQPGQPLWGLTQVLWSDHANSIEARANIEAAFGKAKKALDHGDQAGALAVLKGLEGEVDKVLPADGRAALHDNLTKLQQEAGGLVGTDGEVESPAVTTGSSGSGQVPRGGEGVAPSARSHNSSPSASKPGGVTASSSVGGPAVAQGGTTGPIGGPPASVTDFPIVPVVPATTSSPAAPAGPDTTSTAGPTAEPTAGPGTTTDPSAPAPTSTGATTPVGTTTPAPVDSTAPVTPTSGTTANPPPPPSTSTDPSTTGVPTTDSSSPAPSSATDVPTTDTPTSDPPTSDTPTSDAPTSDAPTTDPSTSTSTTSAIPTTLDTTPSTDSNGSTIGDPSTTATQTAPVNSTSGTDPTDDTGNDPSGQGADSAAGGTTGAGPAGEQSGP